MKRLHLLLLVTLLPIVASAYDAEIDGIYYNFSGNEATVTYSGSGSYSSTVVIPESITWNDHAYSVTGIGESAFEDCSDLTSVIIPNSVKTIGMVAFYSMKLETCFRYCHFLTTSGNPLV